MMTARTLARRPLDRPTISGRFVCHGRRPHVFVFVNDSVLASTVSTVILAVGTRKGRFGRGKQQLLTVGNKIGKP